MKRKFGWKPVGLAVLCVLLCLLAGGIGSYFTMPSIPTWYAGLQKPFFTPPSWVFGPAWTTLYILMGISLAIVLSKGLKKKGVVAGAEVFAVQLSLNAFWSIVFFGMQSPWGGVGVIALLWLAIAATIWKFWGISRKAALLLIPYILWVTFASALNIAVAVMNP